MNPIIPHVNQIFSDDFHKFVLQDKQPIMIDKVAFLKKKFPVDSLKKSKKLNKKEDSPWLPKKKQADESEEEV